MSDSLTVLLDRVVTGLGYDLVGHELTKTGEGGRTLRVYIDLPGGIRLEDCERVSHQLSAALDVDDPIRGAYTLEISSPGLDRPLFTLDHFRRFVGREAKVVLRNPVAGRRRFKATIRQVGAETVDLEEGGETLEVPFSLIDKARLVVEDPFLTRPSAAPGVAPGPRGAKAKRASGLPSGLPSTVTDRTDVADVGGGSDSEDR
jgi:ribosome maturation factor RimP